MDGFVDVSMNLFFQWMDLFLDRLFDLWIDWFTLGWLDLFMDECIFWGLDGFIGVWMVFFMDGFNFLMNGFIVGWMDLLIDWFFCRGVPVGDSDYFVL